VIEYRETGTFVIKVEEAITQQLDDHIVMTQSMSFSPFKKPFQERLAQWEAQLSLVSEVLDEWLALQRQWMYLEPIFSSEDIQHQLPLEGKRFTTVDRIWRKALSQAKATPHIVTMCGSQKLLDVSVSCLFKTRMSCSPRFTEPIHFMCTLFTLCCRLSVV
jgi:dynein heavy chain